MSAQGSARAQAAELNERALADLKAKRFDEAILTLEKACRMESSEPVLQANLASALRQRAQHARDDVRFYTALQDAERALGLAPDDPCGVALVTELRLKLIGVQAARATLQAAPTVLKEPIVLVASARVAYEEDALSEAVQDLASALEERGENAVQPRAALERLLQRWRAEAQVEQTSLRHAAGSFCVKVPSAAFSAMGEQVLRTAQTVASRLESTLGPRPERTLFIVLLESEGWKQLQRGPEWSGGVFDGRIRIPLSQIEAHPDELVRTLSHEMVHWFVRSISPECPLWLNEGLAQIHEPASTPDAAAIQALKKRPWQALATWPEQWTNLDRDEAAELYLRSRCFVQWLVRAEGMPRVLDYLRVVRKGSGRNDAFASVFQRSLAEAEAAFLREWR
jgi:tetratricopeptide (TPR) repeat protein